MIFIYLLVSLFGWRLGIHLPAGNSRSSLIFADKSDLILVRILDLDGLVLQIVIGYEGLLVVDWLFSILCFKQALLDSALQAEPHIFLHLNHLCDN